MIAGRLLSAMIQVSLVEEKECTTSSFGCRLRTPKSFPSKGNSGRIAMRPYPNGL